MHFIAFLRAAPDRSGPDFKSWYVEDYAPSIGRRFPNISRHIANITEPGPEELRLSYDSADPLARYDVVAEIDWEGADYPSAFRAFHGDVGAWADIRNIYRVDSTVVKDDGAGSSPLAGIKFFRELYFYSDMSDAAVKRCWAHHANLALKVHVAATRYVRHWVEERLGPDTPPARGIVEFHFATREDMAERYYVSEAGREQIVHDTGHFIEKRLPRAYVREVATPAG